MENSNRVEMLKKRNQLKMYIIDQELVNYSLWAKFSPLPVFVKVLWEPSHVH